jgi:hypothetical protein
MLQGAVRKQGEKSWLEAEEDITVEFHPFAYIGDNIDYNLRLYLSW